MRTLRVHMPTCLACSRAQVPTCIACSRAHVPTCLACSHANVSCVSTCSRTNLPCVLCVSTCSHVITTNDKGKSSITCFPYILRLFFIFFLWNKTVAHSCISLTSQKSLMGAFYLIINFSLNYNMRGYGNDIVTNCYN